MASLRGRKCSSVHRIGSHREEFWRWNSVWKCLHPIIHSQCWWTVDSGRSRETIKHGSPWQSRKSSKQRGCWQDWRWRYHIDKFGWRITTIQPRELKKPLKRLRPALEVVRGKSSLHLIKKHSSLVKAIEDVSVLIPSKSKSRRS